ncbi:ABC transporter permease [Paraflavitalea pollutisoli]|uniref:ABC transporter permease n=1 Tax=Paraflavitalea pollutisoli TaxID=3034143 RepID=UPI0023EBE117|nr:ABC transporter permease [Paraflavitalea sp. H1-2-19X]
MRSIHLKTAFRNLRKHKAFHVLNMMGLAIGIACAGLILLWVEDERSYDQMHTRYDRLYQVNINKTFDGRVFTMGSTPRPLAAALEQELPGIEKAVRVSDQPKQALFGSGDQALYAAGRYADPAIFDLFTLPFIEGDARTALQELHSLVITEATARKFFGQERSVIGRTVRFNNEHDFIITGVLKDLPGNSTLQFEWLAPFAFDAQQHDPVSWNSYGPYTYVLLKPHIALATVNQQLQHFIHGKDDSQQSDAFLFAMADWHLYNQFEEGHQTGGGRIEQVRLLTTIAWIILLIACINFMNLAIAAGQQRAKEIGVRKVLGAGRLTLFMKFVGEAMLMSTLSAGVAIVIMLLALPGFNGLMGKDLTLGLQEPLHGMGLLGLVLVCGLVAGMYPAFYLSAFKPVPVLKGLKVKAGNAVWVRKGLIVLQYAVSVVFIISTIVVYRQLQHVRSRELGFNKEQLVEIDMQHNIAGSFEVIRQSLLNSGQVVNVALADHATIKGGNTDSRFRWAGKDATREVSVAYRTVSADYLATSGMQLVAGRDFSTAGIAGQRNVLVNETMARLMGRDMAVGKVIETQRGNADGVYTPLTVIGVVKDYVFGNLYGKPGPVILLTSPEKAQLVYVRFKPSCKSEQASQIMGDMMKLHNAAYPLVFRYVEDVFNSRLENEAAIGRASGIFAVLAIVISCLGLFGLAAHSAQRRVKEVGIRKVLGASSLGVMRLLSGEFVWLVVIACGVAFPVAWWMMHDWLQAFEYRVAIAWWIFALAGVLSVIIALVTVSTQAIKAALTNPVRALRAE